MGRTVEDRVDLHDDAIASLTLAETRGTEYRELVVKPTLAAVADRLEAGDKRFQDLDSKVNSKADAADLKVVQDALSAGRTRKDTLTWVWRGAVALVGAYLTAKQAGWL